MSLTVGGLEGAGGRLTILSESLLRIGKGIASDIAMWKR